MMNIHNDVKELIKKIHSGEMKEFLDKLDNSDFGLYISVYMDNNTVKPMMEGYSQTEENLKISINKVGENVPVDAKAIAWMGWPDNKDSNCSHKPGKDSKCVHPSPGGPNICRHCTKHTDKCRHCSHGTNNPETNIEAPELNYDLAIEDLNSKKELLKLLEKEGFGLSLLHGHNDKFMFTKLPEGYISVISNNITSFRTESEVEQDSTFVPSMWRSINGQLRIAGGYSAN